MDGHEFCDLCFTLLATGSLADHHLWHALNDLHGVNCARLRAAHASCTCIVDPERSSRGLKT